MPIFKPRLRCVSSAVLSLFLAGSTPQMPAADLPIERIVLYKHGIGFFERQGVVNAGEEMRLDFQGSDMNDVLKSLTVSDLAGGRINAIRYDSNETPDQRLSKFPFQLGQTELLSRFLDSLKGSRIEAKLASKTVEGAIVGTRATQVGAVHEQITLLLDNGEIANFDLAEVIAMRLLDPKLQDQLKQYLQTLGQTKSREKRSVYIEAIGKDARRLRVSYIVPTAIWKSSYRLILNQPESIFEGWAIVDNTTDEDWSNVQLSVVSGRPISFISLLDTPRYGQRQVAELPEDRAAGPVVYSGSVDVNGSLAAVNGLKGVPAAGLTGEGMGGGVAGGVLGGVGPARPPAPLAMQKQEVRVSSIDGATGAALGELFQYDFNGPITIRKNQSAMLPFLQAKVAARKLLIYTDRDGEHPVNAAELTNTTQKTLDGGPITVYDGGAYAGEALVETLKAGDKRLIGYAVDYGTRVTSQYGTGEQNVREVHVKDGILRVKYSQNQTRTYTIRNVDANAKTLIVQQETGQQEFSIICPKPLERTATAYRFEVKIPANGAQTLKVEQEHTNFTEDAVTNSTPDFLLTIVQNKNLSDAGRAQLKQVADLKNQIVATDQSIERSKSQLSDLTADQTRLRQNIDSLNRVKGQEEAVRNYSTELGNNEAQFAKLNEQVRNLTAQKASLDGQLRLAIEKLDF